MSTIIIPIYVIAIIAAIVTLLVAVLISNGVDFRPDMSDVSKRKTIFWVVSILSIILSIAVAFAFVYTDCKTGSKKSAFMLHESIGAALSWIVYLVLGIIISKANPKGKLGSWF